MYALCRFTGLHRMARDQFDAGVASQMGYFPHRRDTACFHYETLGTSAKRSKVKTQSWLGSYWFPCSTDVSLGLKYHSFTLPLPALSQVHAVQGPGRSIIREMQKRQRILPCGNKTLQWVKGADRQNGLINSSPHTHVTLPGRDLTGQRLQCHSV